MKKEMAVVLGMTLLAAGCTTPGKRTGIGTGAGAATGAGLGAIIGHQAGSTGKGAAIGAAVGAVLGGSIGNRLDRQAKELEQIAETKRTEEGILTKLKSDLLFDVNSADLKGPANESLAQVAGILKQYPEDHVTVVGYTDSTGSDSHNHQLSERRARAVKLALVSHGVPATAIEAMGQGESNPVAPNDSEANRAKNRRVELQISVDPSKVKS